MRGSDEMEEDGPVPALEGALAAEGARPGAAPGAGVEPDTPPTRKLFLQLAALLVVLVAAVGGLWQFFKLDSAAEVYRKELSVPNRELLELRARDEGRLTQFELLDEKAGAYQIPVRRAMRMLVDDPSLLAPVREARR